MLSLPDAPNPVSIEYRIAAHNGKPFGLGLSGQHAVERIAVWPWQQTGTHAMPDGDREALKSLASHVTLEVAH